MADSVTVKNLPDSGSPERVAFDLMTRIANAETSKTGSSPAQPRDYHLDLYSECLHVVRHGVREGR